MTMQQIVQLSLFDIRQSCQEIRELYIFSRSRVIIHDLTFSWITTLWPEIYKSQAKIFCAGVANGKYNRACTIFSFWSQSSRILKKKIREERAWNMTSLRLNLFFLGFFNKPDGSQSVRRKRKVCCIANNSGGAQFHILIREIEVKRVSKSILYFELQPKPSYEWQIRGDTWYSDLHNTK